MKKTGTLPVFFLKYIERIIHFYDREDDVCNRNKNHDQKPPPRSVNDLEHYIKIVNRDNTFPTLSSCFFVHFPHRNKQ